jgi:hypothetical protein
MTQPAVTRRNPIAEHPVTSATIAILVLVAICGTLFDQIYARMTPKIGPFPFFYFYSIVYIPFVSIVLGIVAVLQRRLRPGDDMAADAGEAAK